MYPPGMRAITINVSEPVYRAFQRYARERNKSTSQLIREAMEEYQEQRIRPKSSIAELAPLSLGRMLEPLAAGDDLSGEIPDP